MESFQPADVQTLSHINKSEAVSSAEKHGMDFSFSTDKKTHIRNDDSAAEIDEKSSIFSKFLQFVFGGCSSQWSLRCESFINL